MPDVNVLDPTTFVAPGGPPGSDKAGAPPLPTYEVKMEGQADWRPVVPGYQAQVPPAPVVEEPSGPNALQRFGTDLINSAARGTLRTASDITNTLGAKSWSDSLDKLAGEYHRSVGSIFNINNPADFTTWLGETLTESMPHYATVLGGMAAGGALGGPPGAVLGALGTAYLMNKGETNRQVEAAGGTPGAANTIPAAIVKSVLDVTLPLKMARRMGIGADVTDKIVTEAAAKSGLLTRAANAERLAFVGGTTAGAHEFTTTVNNMLVAEAKLRFPNTDEWKKIADAAAGGYATGGVLGLSVGKTIPKSTTPTAEPGGGLPLLEGPTEPSGGPGLPRTRGDIVTAQRDLISTLNKTTDEAARADLISKWRANNVELKGREGELPSGLAIEGPATAEPTAPIVPPIVPKGPPSEPPVSVPTAPNGEALAKAPDFVGPAVGAYYRPSSQRLLDSVALEMAQTGRTVEQVLGADVVRRQPELTQEVLPRGTTVYAEPPPPLGGGLVRVYSSPAVAQEAADAAGITLYPYKVAGDSVLNVGYLHYIRPETLRPATGLGPVQQASRSARRVLAMAQPVSAPPLDQRLVDTLSAKQLYATHTPRTGQYLESIAETPVVTKVNGTAVDPFRLAPGEVGLSANTELRPNSLAAQQQLTAWVQKYAPKTRLILQVPDLYQPLYEGKHEHLGGDLARITISPDVMQSPKWYKTLVHEFGHAIMSNSYNGAPSAVKTKLHKSYIEFLNKQAAGGVPALDSPEATHLLTFNEFFSLQLSAAVDRQLLGLKTPFEVDPQIVGSLNNTIRRTRKFFVDQGLIAPEVSEGAANLLHYAALTAEIQRVENVIVPLTPGEPTAWVPVEDSPLASIALDRISHSLRTPFERLDPKLRTGLPAFTKVQEYGFSLLQIAERYPQVKGLQSYIDRVQDYWSMKSRLSEAANDVGRAWTMLGNDQLNKLSVVLAEATTASDKVNRRLSSTELKAIFVKHNLSPEAEKMYGTVDGSIITVLEELKKALEYDSLSTAAARGLSPSAIGEELRQISEQMALLMNRNYFPLMRFGHHGVKVIATTAVKYGGRTYQPGETVLFETFEKKSERKNRANELSRSKLGTAARVVPTYLDDDSMAYLGFPAFMLKPTKAHRTIAQNREIEDLVSRSRPGWTFIRYMQSTRGPDGFSANAMRAYARYMMTAASHIARLRYSGEMQKGIMAIPSAELQNETVTRQIMQHARAHYQYLNHPGNEWSGFRAMIFAWLLAFVPKSALVNLTQLGMMAYPELASRYGDIRTIAVMTGAMKDLTRVWKTGKGVTAAEDAAMARAVKEGFLTESNATELAGVAEGSMMSRLLPNDRATRTAQSVMWAGAYMFQIAEKINRHVTFLSALRLSGNDYATAKKIVQTTMLEYARWNRPKMMWGRKAALTMFMQFTLGMSHLIARPLLGGTQDRMQKAGASARIMMLFLALAGLQGLPGAEDIMDAMDAGGAEYKRLTGAGDTSTDVRLAMRQLAVELNLNPDLVAHGITGEMLPVFDLSGSIGMGRVLPGAEPLFRGIEMPKSDVTATLGSVVEQSGAMIHTALGMLKAIASDNPDTWKRSEALMPNFAKFVSQSVRWAVRGVETDNSGSVVATFNMDNPYNMAEILGHAAGFQTQGLSDQRELSWARRQAALVYSQQRDQLSQLYYYAKKVGGPDAVAIVEAKVAAYNTTVPSQQLRLTQQQLNEGYRRRVKAADKQEAGKAPQKMFRDLYQQYNQAWPDTKPPR